MADARQLAIMALGRSGSSSGTVVVNGVETSTSEVFENLISDLEAKDVALTELNEVTLPALEADLATVEGLTTILQAGTIISNIASVGEIRAEHIGANEITANLIDADAINATHFSSNAFSGLSMYGCTLKVDGNSSFYSTHGNSAAYSLDAEYTGSSAPSGYTYFGAIHGNAPSGSGTNCAGVAGNSISGLGIRGESSSFHGVYGLSNSGRGVYGNTSSSSTASGGVYGYASSGVGVRAVGGLYGFYTSNDCFFEGSNYPFTGSHFTITQSNHSLGDIIVGTDAYRINISQSIPFVETSSLAHDKRVFGVCSDANNKNISEYARDSGSLGEYINEEEMERKIKDEYQSYIDYLNANNYEVGSVNALGEGCINVCDENGDIEVGDFLCSSSTKGKAMLQEKFTMQRGDESIEVGVYVDYTVAKALEPVIWADEVIGENDCFEYNGVKCKLIACTYHCS